MSTIFNDIRGRRLEPYNKVKDFGQELTGTWNLKYFYETYWILKVIGGIYISPDSNVTGKKNTFSTISTHMIICSCKYFFLVFSCNFYSFFSPIFLSVSLLHHFTIFFLTARSLSLIPLLTPLEIYGLAVI